MSDFVSAYGVLPFPLDYATYVGLLANVSRLNFRHAYLTAAGVSAASTTKPLSMEWYDSVCESEQEAEDLSFKTNADRASVEIKRKRQF